MLRFFLLPILALGLSACQHTAGEIPEISVDKLAGIDSLFSSQVERGRIAGATALIAQHGNIVYYRSTGYSNLEKKTPLKKDEIFFIASQTKAITSLAAMMLWEEGLFTLDDPISLHLKEFENPHLISRFNPADSTYVPLPATHEPTIRNLLTHTSGYAYPGNPDSALRAVYAKMNIFGGVPNRNSTLKEEMQKIARLPLLHEPGENYTYGLSSDILGYLVETLSGMSLEEYFQTRIFEPLGMKDSYFRLPESKYDRLMTLYAEDPGTGALVPRPMDLSMFLMDKYLFSGGGGLLSTAMDYHIFQQMVLNGGIYEGTRLLKKETVDLMTRNHIGENKAGSLYLKGYPDKFGLGFEIISPPGSDHSPLPEGAYGWGGAFGSLYWMDPVNDLCVILVIQKSGDYQQFRYDFIDKVYKTLQP
jgi:CubicO group peptidase (beta-lactamase class C family)